MSDDFDQLSRFLLHVAGVRGVLVSIDDAWSQIQSRQDYPPGVLTLLGETAAAAALFTGHIKVDGRLSVQLKGQGALRTLFAECTHQHSLRAIAMWEGDIADRLGPRDLGTDALLAITIEKQVPKQAELQRYQGLVPLDSDTLGAAFEQYFQQSEQLPTRILLAADRRRARGLMLQKLPGDGGDEDGWNRIQALFDTLAADELLNTGFDLLLHRLFHDEGCERLGADALRFGCSCSRERVASMLESLGREEAVASIDPELGAVAVQCEFCGQSYRFDPVDLDQLFLGGAAVPASQRVN